MNRKIRFLVLVAFSPQTEIIVEQGCNLAKRYNAEVNMLYVFDSSRTKGFFTKPEDEDKMKRNAAEQFLEYIERQRNKYA
ncbi:MAG: universal stress protein, partial [Flavobacteriales bacterium]|nr:universal stress protein [Flavobacteriales bacterium]